MSEGCRDGFYMLKMLDVFCRIKQCGCKNLELKFVTDRYQTVVEP